MRIFMDMYFDVNLCWGYNERIRMIGKKINAKLGWRGYVREDLAMLLFSTFLLDIITDIVENK